MYFERNDDRQSRPHRPGCRAEGFFSGAAAPVTSMPLHIRSAVSDTCPRSAVSTFAASLPATTYDEGPAHIVSSGRGIFRTKNISWIAFLVPRLSLCELELAISPAHRYAPMFLRRGYTSVNLKGSTRSDASGGLCDAGQMLRGCKEDDDAQDGFDSR